LGDVSEEVLDRLVSKIPIDGKKYTLPEVVDAITNLSRVMAL